MKTYAEYRKQVEEALSGQLRSLGEIPDILLTAMEYSLLAGRQAASRGAAAGIMRSHRR